MKKHIFSRMTALLFSIVVVALFSSNAWALTIQNGQNSSY